MSTPNSNPFAMSFDEIKAQADANMKADKGEVTTQTTTGTSKGKSFLEAVEEAQQKLAKGTDKNEESQTSESGSTGISFDNVTAQTESTSTNATPSFDDMFAQAENATASFDDMFAQAEKNSNTEAPEKAEGTGTLNISFDDLAQAAEPSVGSEKSGAISFDNIVDQAQQALNKAEEPKAEEPKAEKKSGKTTKSKKKEDEKTEPLPDTTEDYKVDLNPEGEKNKDAKVDQAKSEKKTEKKSAGKTSKTTKVDTDLKDSFGMESLFSPDEIVAFRKDIQTFVRKEFKNAMVGAVKELLTEFSE